MTKVSDVIVSLLPANLQDKAKGIVALVLAVLTAVSLLAGAPEWVTIVLIVLNAPAVYGVANEGYQAKHDS